MAEILLDLFGKPEWEIDIEKAKPNDIKKLGKELKLRLENVAKIIGRLEKNGWERRAGLYEISLFKEVSKKDVKRELKKLYIRKVEIAETEDD